MSDANLVQPRTQPDLPPSTDPLAEVLQLLKMNGVLYCNAVLSEPWGIEIPPLPGVMNVEVITSGQCWVDVDGEPAQLLRKGSLALIPRGRRHRLRANPGDPVTPLQDIPVERIGERFEQMHFGGSGPKTEATYFGVRFDPYLADRLIRLLPELLHLHTHADDGSGMQRTIAFITDEARQRLPGSETVITRLADILVIQAIRAWLESMRDEERGWIAALHDRQIGLALALMHRNPAYPWQLESLARETGMSRSGLSARFTDLVGESAMQYLSSLRMQLAHRDLRETKDTLARIAQRVGYQSETTFNRAFKRTFGIPPGRVRKENQPHNGVRV